MPISIPLPAFDSVVINVAERLAETSTLYHCLGFQLFEQDNYSVTSGTPDSDLRERSPILPDGEQAWSDPGVLKTLWQKVRTYFQF